MHRFQSVNNMFESMPAFARIASQSAFAFRVLFKSIPALCAMPFRLDNPCAQGKSIRRSVRPPVLKYYEIKNGKFVKSNAAASLKSRKSNSCATTPRSSTLSVAGPARPSTLATQPQADRPTVPTVCELLGVNEAPRQINATAMLEQDNELGRATACAASTNEYIEQIKSDIRDGVLNLNGNPWVRPCDAQIAAARCLASRKTATRTTIDSVEVRDLVFRPVVFIWAPHLLSLRPLDPYDNHTCAHLNSQWSTSIGVLCIVACLYGWGCPLVSWNIIAVPIVQASSKRSSWVGQASDPSHARSGFDVSYYTAFVFAVHNRNNAKRFKTEKRLQILRERG
jgi:hypothetical protein